MAQYEMSLRDYWRILRKRKWVVIVCCVAAGVLTYFLTQFAFRQPASFSAAAKVSVRPGEVPGYANLIPVNIAQEATVARGGEVLREVMQVIELFPFYERGARPADFDEYDLQVLAALAQPGVRVASTRDLACLFGDQSQPEVKMILSAARAQEEALERKAQPQEDRLAAFRSEQPDGFLYTEKKDPQAQEERDAVIAQLQSRLLVHWDGPTSTFEVTAETDASGFGEADEGEARRAAVALAETIAFVYKTHAEWEGRRAIRRELEHIDSDIKDCEKERAQLESKRLAGQKDLENALASDEYQEARRDLAASTEQLRLLTQYVEQLNDFLARRAENPAPSGDGQSYSLVPAPVQIDDVNIQALYSMTTESEREKGEKLELYKADSHVIEALDARITRTAMQLKEVVQGAIENERLRKQVAERRVNGSEGSRIPELKATIDSLDHELDYNANTVTGLNDRKSQLVRFENQGVRVGIISRPGGAERLGAAGAVAKTVLGALIGLILGVVIAVLWETMDLTIGTIEEVESYLETRVLGVIPHLDTERLAAELRERTPQAEGAASDAELQARAALVTLYDPKSIPAESFRHIRTSLDFVRGQRSGAKVILITSSTLLEGKSTVAANLAVVMAQNGKRTCLVECDLRRPQLHHIFGIERRPGLHDVCIGKMTWQEARKSLSDLLLGGIGMEAAVGVPGLENLSVITCGAVPPNPVELLDSEEARRLFAELRDAFDVVIVDCPPILAVADAAVLSPYVDGAVLVYRAGAAPRTILSRAKTELESVGTELFGVVLNDLRPAAGDLSATYPYKGYSRASYVRSEEGTAAAPRVAAAEAPETAVDRSSEGFEDQIARKVGLLLVQGKVQEAVQAAHDAVRAMPESLSIRLELARAYAAAGRVSDAQAELIRVLDLDPRNLPAIERLAEMATDAGFEREALRWLEEILEFDPQNAKAREQADQIRRRVGSDGSRTV